jgi:hypothetical protein
MGVCVGCGNKAGAFQTVCKSCEAERKAKERQEAAARAAEEREAQARRAEKQKRELEERTAAYVETALEGMRQALAEGRTPFIHTTLYLSAEFTINDTVNGSPPDIHDLDLLGRDGWEIVGTVPQTLGMGLTNVYKSGGQNWGGGIGGMVTGMYVIARLPVTEATLQTREEMLREVLRSRYQDGRSTAVQGPRIPLLANGVDKTNSVAPFAAVAATAMAVSMSMDAMDAMDGGGDDGGDFGGFDF